MAGEDDPSVAWTKNNMANSLRGLGHTQQAIELYHEALATATKHFGTDHPEVAHVHGTLLSLYSQSRRRWRWAPLPLKLRFQCHEVAKAESHTD